MTSFRRISEYAFRFICGLYFWWFRRASCHATSKLDDSPQHRNISCNAKQFNLQIERLMFCKVIRHNATPFVCTLYHSIYITLSHFTQRYTICVYAVPFDITLSHFTQRYTVCMYAVPFYITLSYFTQRYTICAYAVLLDITLCHLTQRYTVCVLYCKWVLSYS